MYYDEGHLNIFGADLFSEVIEKDFMSQFDVILNNSSELD